MVLQPDLPMLDLDKVLFEQVLFNLLDNAGKYAPAGSLITIKAWQEDGHVVVQVLDEGPAFRRPIWSVCSTSSTASAAPIAGVPAPGSASRSAAASSRRWTARITASNRTDRTGAVFTMTLPVFVEADTAAGGSIE